METVWLCLPDFRQRESSYDAVQPHLAALCNLSALQFLDKMRRLTCSLRRVGGFRRETTFGLVLLVLVDAVWLRLLGNPAVLKLPGPSVRLVLCLLADSGVRPVPLCLCGHDDTLPAVLIHGIKGSIVAALVLDPAPVAFARSWSYPFGAVGLEQRRELLDKIRRLVEEFFLGLGLQVVWCISPHPVQVVDSFPAVPAVPDHAVLPRRCSVHLSVWGEGYVSWRSVEFRNRQVGGGSEGGR